MVPIEAELKFLIPPGADALLEQHPKLATVRPKRKRLHTTYFDTPSFALHERGVTLRVRQEENGWVQIVKGHGDTIGTRAEWTWPLDSAEPDCSRLVEAGVEEPLAAAVGREGQPIFSTDVDRIERHVRINGSTVAVAIDTGMVKAGNASADIHEIELELKDGAMSPVYGLAADLLALAPLRINGSSKAGLGYTLATGHGPTAMKAKPPGLPRGMSIAEAVPALIGATLKQFVANIPAAEASDVEGTHQMRVALRRLRTLFVLFAPETEPCARGRLNDAIRALGTPLGAARDWDVFATEALPCAERDGVRPEWIARLSNSADHRRRSAHEAAKKLIADSAPTELVLAVGEWITGDDWAGLDRALPSRKLKRAAPCLMRRLERKVQKRGRDMPDLKGGEMHALRKSVKKLRYGVEYTRSLYGATDEVKAYAKHCKKLQSLLGAINDAAVTTRLIETLVPRDQPAGATAAGGLLAWNERRAETCRRKAERAWRRFRRQRPYWE